MMMRRIRLVGCVWIVGCLLGAGAVQGAGTKAAGGAAHATKRQWVSAAHQQCHPLFRKRHTQQRSNVQQGASQPDKEKKEEQQ